MATVGDELIKQAYQMHLEFYSRQLAERALRELQEEGKIRLEGNKIIWIDNKEAQKK